jgi:AraC-like DNA-binding protein
LSSASMGLRPAASLENYITNPVGRYFAGSNVAAFCVSEAFTGISFWGRPDERDVGVVASAVRAGTSTCVYSHVSLVDLRKLDFLDLGTLSKLWAPLASYFKAFGPLVTRRALLTPRGTPGWILGEVFRSLSPGGSVCSFDDAVAALAWLGGDHRTLLSDLERIAGIAAMDASMVGDLQRLLDRQPRARAQQAANQFGMSGRTFQRRLRELGTSFQREVNQAHVRLAKRLMRETNRPLKWIAIESGYASLQHLSSSFRAQVGVSPTRWRTGDTG